ncbi:RICIN domain-containing protein [Spongiactinospora sp. TRM90649]|uniref:RICIN domain-containing protein n=1 Tax=Spongiactinospora sp. TRM90649 TaxID=3031114 RepID=UPI0023F9AF06|nr:RICIN domain-containing protein [Spongiactinospora sp. TRM90649]MDF5753627.1 RICIN domain-containing protein [Spongiactinospora sp. TRM90649]
MRSRLTRSFAGRLTLLAATGAMTALTLAVPAAHAGGPPRVDEVNIFTFAEKCVDVQGRSIDIETPIIQFTCNGAANQEFRIRRVDRERVEIRTFAGACLDVARASLADGAPIIQYTCHGGANQRFRIERTTAGRVEIRTDAGKCFDVFGSRTANDTPIIQFTCTGNVNQKFVIQDAE